MIPKAVTAIHHQTNGFLSRPSYESVEYGVRSGSVMYEYRHWPVVGTRASGGQKTPTPPSIHSHAQKGRCFLSPRGRGRPEVFRTTTPYVAVLVSRYYGLADKPNQAAAAESPHQHIGDSTWKRDLALIESCPGAMQAVRTGSYKRRRILLQCLYHRTLRTPYSADALDQVLLGEPEGRPEGKPRGIPQGMTPTGKCFGRP